MKFKDLLKGSEFDCELFTENHESEFGFVWDEKMTLLTELGEKHYAKIRNSECKLLKNGNIKLLDDSITYDELRDFLGSLAGHTGQTRYNELFKEVEE